MEVLSTKPRITMTEAEFQAIKDFWNLIAEESFADIDWCDVEDTLNYYGKYFETKDRQWLQDISFEIILKKSKENKK